METNPAHILSFTLFLFLVFLFLPHLVDSTTFNITTTSTCDSSIAECNEELEMLMESEISRRFLEQKKYISPGALKKDQPVCNSGAGGEPYSRYGGCLPQPSNPYNRGCSKYYRCRSDA